MNEEEFEEYKKYKETKEVVSVFNDDNVINYLIKRYKEIKGYDLHQYYNYLENRHPTSDRRLDFDLKSGNKSVNVSSISVKTGEWC